MNANNNHDSNPIEKSEADLKNIGEPFDSILVAVDFSEITQRVYAVAANLAERLRAKVVVLNVSEPQLDYVGLLPTMPDAHRATGLESYIEGQLLEARKFMEQRGLRVEVNHHWGPVVAAIVEGAQRRGASLIVLGSHGHGALYNLLVGSVAEGVLRASQIPVLVVPSIATASQSVAVREVKASETSSAVPSLREVVAHVTG
jgi:nucleotide-binding universal stress UspA family protein